MALTKDQIINRLASKIINKTRQELDWPDIVAAVGSASNADKETLVQALRIKNPYDVGRIIFNLVEDKVKDNAINNITNKLANNSLNIDELSDILE